MYSEEEVKLRKAAAKKAAKKGRGKTKTVNSAKEVQAQH
jgi:hypothetical protein